MDIKSKIKKINNNTYFYKYEDTVHYSIMFSFAYNTDKLNYLKGVLLCNYITQINEDYKTIKSIKDKCKELYSITFMNYNSLYKDKSLLNLGFRCIDPKRVKDDYFKDVIDFIKKIYFNPYFIDGKLDKNRFDLVKNDFYNKYINFIKEINFESNMLYDTKVLKNSTEGYHYFKSKEELKSILDNIKDKDIIDFYNETINNHYKTTIFGNLSNKDIDLIMNNFNFNNSSIKKISDIEKITLDNKYEEYISKDFTQSILNVSYNIKNYDKYSTEAFESIISHMSNSTEGMYLSLLRGKYGLVYSGYVCIMRRYGIFKLEANIDKKNKDKTINAIKEYISDMHDKKKVKQRLEYAKKKIKENLYLNEESVFYIESEYDSIVILNKKSDRSFIREVNSITVDDIIDFFDNLENENIFFYVGDKNE